jgi:ATPase subunit of ABC transporter with duplicated ATPase domains
VLEGAAEIGKVERRLRHLEAELAAVVPGDPRGEALTATYGDLRHRFEVLGGDHVEAKARAILTGLGVEQARFSEPLAHLSGGWRMRVVLARLLLGAPDLLLLDEPRTTSTWRRSTGWRASSPTSRAHSSSSPTTATF